MINRAALILKYKEPFIKWINESDPYDKNPNISQKEANKDQTVYLIDELEAENLEEFISLNYNALFENELEGWYTDETLWPSNRDLTMFYNLFELECHSVVIDAGKGPIIDDED